MSPTLRVTPPQQQNTIKLASDPVNDFLNPPKGGPKLNVDANGGLTITGGKPMQATPATQNPYVKQGLDSAAKTANPVPNANQLLNADFAKQQREARNKLVNSRDTTIPIKAFHIDNKTGSDAQVVKIITLQDPAATSPANKNGKLLMVVKDTNFQEIAASIPGVTSRSTTKDIQTAVLNLLQDRNKYPNVYTHNPKNTAQPYSSTANLVGVDINPTTKLSMQEQRDALLSDLNTLPPVVKEGAGFMVSLWFETMGKMGITASELKDTFDKTAKDITQSPQAWQSFVNNAFPADRAEFKEARAYFAEFPKGGAEDNKTKLAIILAADTKFTDAYNKAGEWAINNPKEAAGKMLQGVGNLFKAGIKDLIPENSNNFGDNIGAYAAHLFVKTLTVWIPTAQSAKWTASLATNLVKMSPKLLASMGKQGFEAAKQNMAKASQRLKDLAVLSKKPAGLNPAQKTEQHHLAEQLNKAIDAIHKNNPEAFKQASQGLVKVQLKPSPKLVPLITTTPYQLLGNIKGLPFEQQLTGVKDWVKRASNEQINALEKVLMQSEAGTKIWKHPTVNGAGQAESVVQIRKMENNRSNINSPAVEAYINNSELNPQANADIAGNLRGQKYPLLLTTPKNPFQSVVSVPPPSPESIPRIPQPTKVIGAGEVNVIHEHPMNPNLVVSMTNAKGHAQMAKYSPDGDAGPMELAAANADVNALKWLDQAGLLVIKPIELVRVGSRYGVVKPKITDAIFSKDVAPASTDAWRQLVKLHGREIIQQLHQIDRTFRTLSVTDTDFQFYITKRGQVTLYDPGRITPEPDPSHYQRGVSALWIDRIKVDLLRIRHDQPVIGPVTGAEQKHLIRSH